MPGGKLILLGEGSLRRALRHYEAHFHEERNHQGKDNVLLFPLPIPAVRGEQEKVRCRERLGGLLKYYDREAAQRLTGQPAMGSRSAVY
jgi:putative transposase